MRKAVCFVLAWMLRRLKCVATYDICGYSQAEPDPKGGFWLTPMWRLESVRFLGGVPLSRRFYRWVQREDVEEIGRWTRHEGE